jgi:hypothetical protein
MTGIVSPVGTRPISGPGSQIPDVPETAEGNLTYYRYLAAQQGQAADNVRSMTPEQLQQLAGGGVPNTADQVINLGTATTPASPDTVTGYDRQQRLKSWLAGSDTTPPADWQSLASNLPPSERAKLDQAFQDNKPRSLAYLGQQVGGGIASVNNWEQQHPDLFPQPTPGTWPDRIIRSGWSTAQAIPAGTGQLLDDGLTEIGTRTHNAPNTPMPGETPEHFQQRVHPFTQDAETIAGQYGDELGPIATGLGHAGSDLATGNYHQALTDAGQGFHTLGNHLYNDPVGTIVRYYPPARLLGKGVGAARGLARSSAATDAEAATGTEPTAESLPLGGRTTPAGTPVGTKPDSARVDKGPHPSVDRSPLADEADKPAVLDLYHGTAARHADTIRQDGIDLSYGRPDADFGKGFYVTNNLGQAIEWMKHQTHGEPGSVLHYRVPVSELEKLSGRSFPGPDVGWQDLVRGMRSQTDPMHPYDWVEGPLLLNPQDFVAGKPPVTGGHQISVHTPDAVELLNRSLTDHDASH